MANIISTAFYSVLIPLIILSILIVVHEIGHFVAAIKCGVGVKEFALGMGPKILKKQIKGILFTVRLFPIGGFVSMVGEDEESDSENSLNKKPIWKRIIVNIAGASMNILLGFIVMAIYLSNAQSFPTTQILEFNPESLSVKSGLQIGDTITKIDGKSINITNDLYFTVLRKGTKPVDVTVIRDGKKEIIKNVNFPTDTESGTLVGKIDFRLTREEKNFGTMVKQTFYNSLALIDTVWSTLYDLITGRFGMESMSGPIGVTQEIGKSVKEAVETKVPNFLFLIAFITINMGVMNLLPLPALDGGRLVFLLIEAVRRKPVNPEYEGYVHLAGLLALFLFMIAITFKDIQHYFLQ